MKKWRFLKRNERRKAAEEQVQSLLDLSFSEALVSNQLSERHARIAWNISTRFNIRLGKRRRLFCRNCKSFVLGSTCMRYRLSKKRRGVNVTCLKCGATSRIIFS